MGVLVVSGGSRGIGAEICRVAATRGWSVCVNYASSKNEADAVVAQIISAGGKAITAQADISVEADVAAMFKLVDEQLGPVTGLVNTLRRQRRRNSECVIGGGETRWCRNLYRLCSVEGRGRHLHRGSRKGTGS